MPTEPLVSVIISTYNRPAKLDKAIESVVKQSHQNWELFVVDDCSPGEETQAVGKKWMEADKRITYIRAEKNHGYGNKPRNTGILASKGEYICYLDDDCEFLTRHIERLVAELVANKADVVYADQWLVTETGQRAEGIAMDFDGQYLLNKNFIDTNEVLHTREIIFAVGGWDETLPRFMDWNLWVRMMKWGAKFHHVVEKLSLYHISPDSTAVKHPVEMTRDPYYGTLFKPTFDPAGCFIYGPWLFEGTKEAKTVIYKQDETKENTWSATSLLDSETKPKVAVFTLSYDRLEYTKQFFKNAAETAGYEFDWFVLDQGSKDGSAEWLKATAQSANGGLIEKKHDFMTFRYLGLAEKNMGITGGSNKLVDEIQASGEYQIIIKVDNDCLFLTHDWLHTFVDLWKRNHRLYMSPYVEGLVQNPGGAQRVGYAYIGPYFVEVTQHIGGIFAFIDARAYKTWRWSDQFLHGNQDAEASQAFRSQGYMPMYLPLHRVQHCDGTEGQHAKFPEYFERRKKEKTQVYQPNTRKAGE